jgi:hypothetical protein
MAGGRGSAILYPIFDAGLTCPWELTARVESPTAVQLMSDSLRSSNLLHSLPTCMYTYITKSALPLSLLCHRTIGYQRLDCLGSSFHPRRTHQHTPLELHRQSRHYLLHRHISCYDLLPGRLPSSPVHEHSPLQHYTP